jgi:23S rRNA pseudouridine2605 synthase
MTDFKSIFEKKTEEERIAKRMARAGLCSRREAERWILAKRVIVDGVTIDTPAVKVNSDSSIIVDGKEIPTKEAPRLWRYHKPTAQITSNRDVRGRQTVFDNLPKDIPRVVSVGRLDYDSEGLLLLTNDGELARLLELPSTAWIRRYRVRVYGRPQSESLERLSRGVTLDGIKYGAIDATLDKQGPSNAWLTIGLREGKNREVRRLLESIELRVMRLIRVSFGPFQLGNLEAGNIEEIKQRNLKEQLGIIDGTVQNHGRAESKKRNLLKTKDKKRNADRSRSPSRR